MRSVEKQQLTDTLIQLAVCLAAQVEHIDNGYLEAIRHPLRDCVTELNALYRETQKGALLQAVARAEYVMGLWQTYALSDKKPNPLKKAKDKPKQHKY